ncbi:MAG: hypothetical protein J5685_06850, partial [Clostridiales bacterium]|nr:hypothetical protein [Clostridiales bacterium]
MRKGLSLKLVCIIAAFVFLLSGVTTLAAEPGVPAPNRTGAVTVQFGSSTAVTESGNTLKFIPEISGIYGVFVTGENLSFHNTVAIYDGDTLITDDACSFMHNYSMRLTAGKTYYIVAYDLWGNDTLDYSVIVSWGCLPVVGVGSNKISYDESDAEFRIAMGSRHVLSVEVTPELCPTPSYHWECGDEALGDGSTYITPRTNQRMSPVLCYVTSGDVTSYCRFFINLDDGLTIQSPRVEDILIDPGDTVSRQIEYTYDMPEDLAAEEISYGLTNYFGNSGSGRVLRTPEFSVTPGTSSHVLYQ